MLARSTDIVIVGAGICGIATAWALTQRGVPNVVLVDRRAPLSLTSNRPEANYRTWWPQPAMVDLAVRSLEIIDGLAADGAAIPMDRRGYLYISENPASAEVLGSVVARHPATRVSGAVAVDDAELHRRWPHLGPGVTGGIFVANAGGLDTVALGQAMLDRAVASGVRVVRDEISGVDLTSGRVVIDAAGPFAREVARLAGAELALETVLRQKVVVRDSTGVVPRNAPFTITLDGRSLPWNADERAGLGASAEGRLLLQRLPPGIHVKPDDASGPGALKIGWAWDQRATEPNDDPACPPDFPRMVQLGASTFIPGLSTESDVLAHEGGYYARTPDGRPLIGSIGTGAASAFFAVAGFAGFGAMMAAAAGDLAADLICGRTVATDVAAAFDPRRFDDAAYLESIRNGTFATGEL